MPAGTLTVAELLTAVGLTEADLAWYHAQFHEQMRLLVSANPDGEPRYSHDTVLLLRGLSAMRAQGATPDQIKGWFGLAAAHLSD